MSSKTAASLDIDFFTRLWTQGVDLSQPSLWLSIASITFNPLVWNIVARHEYRNKTITRIFGGNVYYGCYFLALNIFGFGLLRDTLFRRALVDQPTIKLLPAPYDMVIPALLVGLGQLFVLSSTWQLGITGTFLGDYFGILMKKRVEGFPFNVLRDPMYVGSTMSFAGGSLWVEKPAGLFITAYVYILYTIALKFEGPFTDAIYANQAKNSQKKAI